MENKNENEKELVTFEQNGTHFACSQEKEELMRTIAKNNEKLTFDLVISF